MLGGFEVAMGRSPTVELRHLDDQQRRRVAISINGLYLWFR